MSERRVSVPSMFSYVGLHLCPKCMLNRQSVLLAGQSMLSLSFPASADPARYVLEQSGVCSQAARIACANEDKDISQDSHVQ